MIAESQHRSEPSVPQRAIVLAAGLGVRMRPITNQLPKPLVEVAGRSLLDRILDRLSEAGVTEAVVNTFHLRHLIEAHLAARMAPPVTLLSNERTLLETGGGVANALPLLGDQAFFAINGDVLWQDAAKPALAMLAEAWDSDKADALLLLQPKATAIGYEGPGDFYLSDQSQPARRGLRPNAPFLFAGLQILHPRLFHGAPGGPFSLNILYDRALAHGRLFAIVHTGRWCHVGTPDDILHAEAFLADQPPDDISESSRSAGTA